MASPLHYRIFWNDYGHLISHFRRTAEVHRGGIPRKFCACMVTDRIWQEYFQPALPFNVCVSGVSLSNGRSSGESEGQRSEGIKKRPTQPAHSAIAIHDKLF